MTVWKIILAIAIAGLSLIFAIDFRFFFLLIVFVIVLFTPLSIFNRRIFYLVALVPFFLLPQLNRYDVLPILSWNIALPILILIFLFALTKFRLDNSYNFLFICFTFYMVFQFFRGWNLGYDRFYVFSETIKYLFYPIGFYFTYSLFNDDKSDYSYLKTIMFFFIIMGLIISFEILYYYFNITLGKRVITRQTNLLLVSFISALVYLLFFSKKIYFKILIIMSLIIYLLATIIMMQRSLWIGFLFSVLVFVVFVLLKIEKKKTKGILFFLILLILIIGSYNIYKYIAIDKEILQERTEVVEQKASDFSIGVRLLSYVQAWHLFMQNPIFGKGMGDAIITPYLNQREIGAVDNSYLVILWKFGIVGFFLWVLIYVHFISQLLKIISKSTIKLNKIYSIAILSIIIGQMINGLACVVMTLYYFNFIWASLIAITDYLYRMEFNLDA